MSVSKLNEFKQTGYIGVSYAVTIEVVAASRGDHVATGSASSAVLNTANVAAVDQVLEDVAKFVVKEAESKKRGVQWQQDFSMFVHQKLGFPKFTMVQSPTELNSFVDAELVHAHQTPAQTFHFVAMDSEGHMSKQAKYIQLAGKSSTVVAFLSPEAIESLAPLFNSDRIKMVVFDATAELRVLPKLFNSNPARLYDLQQLARIIMDTGSGPSLENFTSYLLGRQHGSLVKMANLNANIRPYDAFESDADLPVQLQYYAAMDALATLWAFNKCRELIQTQSEYPTARAFDSKCANVQ